MGRTATNPAGYDNAGLDVVFADGAVQGDIHNYQAVTNPPAGTPLAGTWAPDGRNVDPQTVIDTSPRSTSLTNFIGLGADGEWTLYLADLESGGTNLLNDWGLEITGSANPTLTWLAPADIAYGAALGSSQLNATATYDSTNVNGTFTYNPPIGAVLSAGAAQTLSVVFSPADTSTFLPVTNSVLLNVNPAPLAITANARSKTYGTALALGATAFSVGSGLASGESVTEVTLTATGGTAATAGAGSYTISPSAALGSGGFLAANYNITYNPGTLTVSALAVSLSGSRAYDGTTGVAAAVLSVTNALGSDEVGVASGSGTLAGANVGSQAISSFGTLVLGGAAASNYTLLGASGTVTITLAPLAITANARSKTYGTALTLGATAFSVGSGLASGESVTEVTLTATGGTAATAGVGSYTITPSAALGSGGFLAANYSITYNSGILTVSKAVLTVQPDSASRVYGQADPVFTASYSGFQNGETLPTSGVTGSPSLTTTATATSPVPGPYPITVAAGTLAADNYSFSFVDGQLTIAKATTIALVHSSTNPALPGASVTFTEVLNAGPPGSGTPNGTVSFRIDGVVAGASTLSGGSAAFTTDALTHGIHTVVAEYPGDGNFIGATNHLLLDQVINTPPTGGAITILRDPAQSVKVLIAALLASNADADGDPITFVGASATSTNGGAISSSGSWLLYTPVPGYTNADAFAYTIGDGYVTVTNWVMVSIRIEAGSSSNLTVTNLGNGSYAIYGNGIPNYTYRVLYADDVPGADWRLLGTVTANAVGFFEIIDTNGAPQRIYRSVYP